jgi:hypothetical protein
MIFPWSSEIVSFLEREGPASPTEISYGLFPSTRRDPFLRLKVWRKVTRHLRNAESLGLVTRVEIGYGSVPSLWSVKRERP